jgi:hypothetical protein
MLTGGVLADRFEAHVASRKQSVSSGKGAGRARGDQRCGDVCSQAESQRQCETLRQSLGANVPFRVFEERCLVGLLDGEFRSAFYRLPDW